MGYAWQSVLDEIAKCQLVCANCHRIKSILESNKMAALDRDEILRYASPKMQEEFLGSYCVPVDPAVDTCS